MVLSVHQTLQILPCSILLGRCQTPGTKKQRAEPLQVRLSTPPRCAYCSVPFTTGLKSNPFAAIELPRITKLFPTSKSTTTELV